MISLARRSPRIRRYLATIGLMVVLLPILAIGAIRSIDSMCVVPERWVPATFESRQTYDWFARHFETGDVVLVSWDGCTVDDPRLARLDAFVANQSTRDRDAQLSGIIDRGVTGFGAMRGLMDAPLNLSRDQAIDRLTGSLIGTDHRSSCALMVMTPEGNRQRRQTIQKIQDLVSTECGVPKEHIHTVGPPVNGVAIDDASVLGINRFSSLSIVVAALLCWVSLRSWLYTLTIVGTGVFGQAVVLSAVYYWGQPLDAILIIIPSLVLVLTVSAGVHLVNYYRDEVRLRGVNGAAERALSKGLRPCLLSTATTAIGVGSLTVSQITPVVMFGIVASLGIVVSVGTLLLLLPGALELFPLKPSDRITCRFWKTERVYSWLVSRPNLTAALCLAPMLLAAGGLPRLTTSVDVVSLFSERSRLVNDYRWFESHIGPSVPVEVILSFDKSCKMTMLQRMRLVDKVQQHINHSQKFAAATSAATLAPPLELQGALAQRLLRSRLLEHRLTERRADFVEAHMLADSESAEMWRVSARTTALGQPDYPGSLRLLKQEVSQILASEIPRRKVAVHYTGMMPLASTVQQEVLSDLNHSFLTAVALVGLVMVCTMRSLIAGLLCMLPNVFPIVLVFGVMGLTGNVIDIGMIMTASVALGIAIDDTLHFLAWYRRERSQGAPAANAVLSSVQHCGRAMVQTTLICGLGLSMFSLSEFIPTRQFAFMMCVLLATALIADLVLLPALICGGMGKYLVRPGGAGMQESCRERLLVTAANSQETRAI